MLHCDASPIEKMVPLDHQANASNSEGPRTASAAPGGKEALQ